MLLRSLRLTCDLGNQNAAIDPRTNLAPSAIRGASLLLQLAAFRDGAIADVSAHTALTVIVRALDDAGALGAVQFSEAIAGGALTSCTASAWRAGTGQHAEIPLDGDDLNIAAGRYKIIVYGLTVSGLVPWAFATFTVVDVGLVDGDAPTPTSDYYTKTEADALFVPQSFAEGAFRVSPDGEFIQLKDEVTDLWHSIWFANGVLQIGEGEA